VTLLTTIVPTYRRPVLLKRAVLSVLNQSCPDFVVRILDNASGDETETVARELMGLDSRVEYFRHPQNIGGLQNMIYGMERVTTPYFSVLCDDDVVAPDFVKAGLDGHAAAEIPLAFVATRVVAVDEAGQFSDPFAHPREAVRLTPPEGVQRCLLSGVSLPGVIYRTSAMQAVGAPRPAWWNWTESGWHALAAITAPIAFTTTIGAIVYVHADSASKRMDAVEFKVSWFRMLREVRQAARRANISDDWWAAQIAPVARRRFQSTLLRLCRRNADEKYEALGELGVGSGLSPRHVARQVAVARVAGSLGLGEPINAALDWFVRVSGHDSSASAPPQRGDGDAGIRAAAEVFTALNHQAGLH
jgi:glycosyltransferase involved in cell wall biosynthesis